MRVLHVGSGEEIIIARAGKPIAILSGIQKPIADRVPGTDAGLVHIQEDFDDPLPGFDV